MRKLKKVSKWLVLMTVVMGMGSLKGQTTYYVSNNGDDNNNGIDPSSPWKTISKVNSFDLSPGDSILFKRGDVWREELVIEESGTTDAWILFGNYGEGDLPRILGSEKVANFVPTGVSDIWKGLTPVNQNPDRGIPPEYWDGNIYFEGTNGKVNWGHFEDYSSDFSNLTDTYDWTWNNDTIYVYSTTDPDELFNSVEAPQRDVCITTPSGDIPGGYLCIDGFELRYAFGRGIWTGYPGFAATGLIVKNCYIGYIGIKGSASAFGIRARHSEMKILNNEIHDCGRRSLSIGADASSNFLAKNILVEGNYFYNGYHTTGVDISCAENVQFDSIVIRNNYFEGNPDYDITGEDGFTSNFIYVENKYGSTISNLYIYNNILTIHHGKGVMVQNIDTCYIVHNTFYGFNPSLDSYQGHIYCIGADNSYINILNNISYNDADYDYNDDLMNLRVTAEASPDVFSDYNLYYTTDDRSPLTIAFGTRRTINDWITYQNETGWDTNSPQPSNPLFLDPPYDLSLQENSPAKGAGIILDWIKTDFFGKPMNIPPNFGAIQTDCSSANVQINGSIRPDSTGLGVGSIEVTVTGGLPPYSYKWDNNNTTENLYNLTSGVYELTVIDDNFCYSRKTFKVESPILKINSSNQEKTNILLYPNPASDFFFLEIKNNSTIRIIDVSGKLVFEKENSDNLQKINCDFNKGIYTVQIITKNKVQSTKLIIQ